MRLLKLSLLILIITIPVFGQGYKLIWSDEFTGTTLNAANWTRETGGNGWGNSELQYYTDRDLNCFVADGFLTIKAFQELYGGRNYTSARIKTQGKQFFKYGKIEARIKLPYGQGIWPAFWMLGESISSVGWPACGEIDIMEMVGGGAGRDNKIYGTAHWDNNGHQSYGLNYTLPSGNFSDDFHLFTITWDAEKIEWYMDGIKYCTFSILPAYLSEFKENHFIILNLAVGGAWPGPPNGTTVFPQTMMVDYVRAYKDTLGQPSINMISPANGAVFNPGDNIVLKSEVVPLANIRKVEFYQDQVKIGETNVAPYEVTWRNVQPGCYKIKATVYSTSGYTGTSEFINIKVGNTCGQAPYKGYSAVVPGKIELENFDLGGNNVAYLDNTPANQGGYYRQDEAVDIQACTDAGGGYSLGYITTGEWAKYSIKVLETGSYTFNFRAASQTSSWGVLQAFIDGVDVTGEILISNTGGWQNWATISKSGINLTQGNHELKLLFSVGDYNLNYLNIVKTDAPVSMRLLYPNGGEVLQGGTIQEVSWQISGIENLQIGLSTDNGSSWLLISNDFPANLGSCRFLVPSTGSTQGRVMIIDKVNAVNNVMSAQAFTITPATGIEKEKPVASLVKPVIYPNPVTGSSKIAFTNTADGLVTIKIFNMLGAELAVVLNEPRAPGQYQQSLGALKLSPGVYFAEIITNSGRQTSKFSIVN